MEEIILNFLNEVNASLSVGDVVLFGVPDSTGDIAQTTRIGRVTEVLTGRTSVRVERFNNAPLPPSNAFIMFTKNKTIESSGIIGYEATVTMKNTSTTKAELFAVSSEVFESSR